MGACQENAYFSISYQLKELPQKIDTSAIVSIFLPESLKHMTSSQVNVKKSCKSMKRGEDFRKKAIYSTENNMNMQVSDYRLNWNFPTYIRK